MNQSLLTLLIPFALFFAWLLFFQRGRKACPECGARLPGIQSPFTKTKRQWLAGGYVCPNCGCETATAGRQVLATAPILTPIGVCAGLVASLGLAAILLHRIWHSS